MPLKDRSTPPPAPDVVAITVDARAIEHAHAGRRHAWRCLGPALDKTLLPSEFRAANAQGMDANTRRRRQR